MDPTLEDVHASRNYTTPMNKFPENRVFCFYVRFFCTDYIIQKKFKITTGVILSTKMTTTAILDGTVKR